MRNNFCDSNDLRNESDVEQSFARRLIEALGYADRSIRTKDSLESLTIGRLPHDQHRPDFAIKISGHIRWILEAKSPTEQLQRHVGQARRYCQTINAAYTTTNPVEYYVLTNGIETHLYNSSDGLPFATLQFSDFVDGNPQYHRFVSTLRPSAFSRSPALVSTSEPLRMRKPTIAEINGVFASCHQHIYDSDHISQAAGFVEFVKLITLKLLSDKHIKESNPGLMAEREFEHPSDDVRFSINWIETHELATPNPVNSILFSDFMTEVEREIARRVRKRFFDIGEQINLKPETIKGVVERLEHLYLFGIDADLNGRLFENFLSATMRGKDLGQYFTPRTIVKLGVGLADLRPSDLVLDGCCGTGGFLIDALSDMWGKVNRNQSLTPTGKENQRRNIANEQIFGIDFAKNPNLAKIARLNMYLHGDGGSRIFNVDSLDIQVQSESIDSDEETVEKDELREFGLSDTFDVVLTNPPFSKNYDRTQTGDARILDQFTMAVGRKNVNAKLLFFELYHHYLKPGGRLISIIDDGFLSSSRYRWFRTALRQLYIVRGIISLPGDAFQRSDARVKTSFIMLEKRRPEEPWTIDDEPSIFVYPCRYVGIDDPKRVRSMPGDDEIRDRAREEVTSVVDAYNRFLLGNEDSVHIVQASRADDRLDVKHLMTKPEFFSVQTRLALSDIVRPKQFDEQDIIDCPNHNELEQLFTVSYDGEALPGRQIVPSTETKYAQLFRISTGDIVISNIAATYGSVAVVPPELGGLVVSKEYTVLNALPGFHETVVWALLRSAEIRAQFLLRSTGANRTRVSWTDIQDVSIMYPQAGVVDSYLAAMQASAQARATALREHQAAITSLNEALSLEGESAEAILDAFKPPR